ncbi:hypothetical protein HYU95_04815 [Candidatus Daviesbacteria bacterium]|nr:hypothetical protein [Candidatus Daviesbacteria bacterium]
MEDIRIDFPCRAEANALNNGTNEPVNILRVDTPGRKFEAVIGCRQDPAKCEYKGPGGICWAPITINGKNHQETAVVCGKFNSNLQKALDKYGGIKEVPFVEEIKISSRRKRPEAFEKLY